MMQRLRNEPVVVAMLTRVAALLGAKLGLQLTVDDVFLLWGVVEVVTTLVTRSKVEPVQKRASQAPPAP